MLETALYPTVKRFLEELGFQVKGEVNGCDIVAVRDGGPPRLGIVEMKRGFNLDLLLQAVDRMRAADEVWLAVPATRRGRDRDPCVHRLCRLIGLGLMAVDAARNRIEVLAEPGSTPAQPVAQRACAAQGRPLPRWLDTPAGDDGVPSAGSCLRRRAARGPGPAARSAGRGGKCRQDSAQ